MSIDLQKEIKLSDLFRRKPKEPTDGQEPQEPKKPKRERKRKEPKPAKERKPRTSFRRRRAEEEPKLGLRGVTNTAPTLPNAPLMRAFNLLPKEEARGGDGRPPLAAVLVALAGLLVFAGLGFFFLRASAGVAERESTLDELRGDLAALAVPQKPPGAGDETALQDERAARTTALVGALGTRIAWDRLLRDFSLVLPEEVSLTTLQATAPTSAAGAAPVSNTFTIAGSTEDQEGVALLLARLATLPELTAVQLQSATVTDTETSESVTFAITASIKPVGGTG
jgi:Tfp pilus assembly protein PilN